MANLKPLNAVAAYLTLRHAENQDEIANQLAVALFPLWQIVRFNELDASVAMWLPAVLPRIRTAYMQSQRVTGVYIQNLRFASLPTEPPLPITVPVVEEPPNLSPGAFEMPPPTELGEPESAMEPVHDEFDTERVARSLSIEASAETKKRMPGDERELMHNALVRTSGTAVREAINGSRNVTNNVIRIDRRVIGYARVTDGDPCYFCALLASRGAVYTKDSFLKSDAKFTANPRGAKDLPDGFIPAKVHNNCRCTLRPVYSRSQAMDDEALFYRKQWNDFHKRHKDQNWSSKKMVAEFRKIYRPYERQDTDVAEVLEELRQRRDALLDAGFSPASPQVRWAERTAQLVS